MQRAQPEIVQAEIAERLREAERFRRGRMARQAAKPSAAARKERRFFLFRLVPSRASEA